jgi:hypothetical protein
LEKVRALPKRGYTKSSSKASTKIPSYPTINGFSTYIVLKPLMQGVFQQAVFFCDVRRIINYSFHVEQLSQLRRIDVVVFGGYMRENVPYLVTWVLDK